MSVAIYPVTQCFVAEVGDVDLSRQMNSADLNSIKEAFAKYAVLIFPDQHLSPDQHLDFARNFGPLDTTIGAYRKDAALRLRKELTDVSNLDSADEIWGRKTDGACFSLVLASGIPTTPLNACRRARRCSMPAPYRRLVVILNSPTNARLMMRCPWR